MKFPFEMLRVYSTDTPSFTAGVIVADAWIFQLPYWLLILLLFIAPLLSLHRAWRKRQHDTLVREVVEAKRAEMAKQTARKDL
jgi:hypothetical protein